MIGIVINYSMMKGHLLSMGFPNEVSSKYVSDISYSDCGSVSYQFPIIG